jgi:hypothetical protein
MAQRNNRTTVIIGWRRKRKIREYPIFFGSSMSEKKGDPAVGQPFYATRSPRSLMLSSEQMAIRRIRWR